VTKGTIVQTQTRAPSETTTSWTWLLVAKIGAGAFIVWAVGLQLAAGFFDPIIILLALIYAVSLWFLDAQRRGRMIGFTVFAGLTMIPNLVFGGTDFAHLESAGSFVPQLFVTLAIAMAIAGGVGVLRGWSHPSARTTIGRAAILFAAGLGISLVVSATAPSDGRLPDDVTVNAAGFAWDPGVVTYDTSTASGLWIDNRDFAQHELAVTELGIDIPVPSLKSRRIDLGDVEPGTYQIICTIPGHEAMKATLEVTG
jgi:hypothetical protein